jgi:hypothetical protein
MHFLNKKKIGQLSISLCCGNKHILTKLFTLIKVKHYFLLRVYFMEKIIANKNVILTTYIFHIPYTFLTEQQFLTLSGSSI